MREHLNIFVPAVLGVLIAPGVWIWLAGKLARRNASRWWALPLMLPLLLAPAFYGLFWWGFFASPASAVQLHAIRLTIQHFVEPFVPWIGGVWLAGSLALLLPLVRR